MRAHGGCLPAWPGEHVYLFSILKAPIQSLYITSSTRRAIPSVPLALAMTLVVVACVAVVRTDKRLASAPPWYWRLKLEWEHEAQIVLAGDSRVYRGLAPGVFEHELRGRCLNFGFSGTGYEPRYLAAIERVLRTDGARPIIVLGVTAWSLTPRAALANGYLEAEKEYRQNKFPARWRSRLDVIWIALDRVDIETRFGHELINRAPAENYLQDFRLDGWVASDFRKREPERGFAVAMKDHENNLVDYLLLEQLASKVREWREKGYMVFAFNPPGDVEADKIVADVSGFDEKRVAGELRAAGAHWIDAAGSFTSYDGVHLTEESAFYLSHIIAKEIAATIDKN